MNILPEWLGEKPITWKLTRLKYLARINTGSKDTQDKKVNGKYNFYVRSQKIEKIDVHTNEGEAILTAGDGVGVGKVFHYVDGKYSVHQRVYIFNQFKSVLGKFLYYYLKSNLGNEVLNGNAKSTVDSLRKPLLNDFIVIYPDLSIQKMIVKFIDSKLSKIDSLISLKEKQIKLLEEQRQAMITEAVTKGLNPNVKMKDSGVDWIGEIPEHWRIVKLKNIASKKKYSFVDGPFGSDLKNEEYTDTGVPLIQLNQIKNGVLKLDNARFISEQKAKDLSRHKAFPGDLVIAKMASPIVRSAIVPQTKQYNCFVIVADCVKLDLDKKQVTNVFINYWMNTKNMEFQASKFSSGSTRNRVNLGIIKNLFITLPPLLEQQNICDFLLKKDEEYGQILDKITIQISKLKEYRQSLIHEAVTGKIPIEEMESYLKEAEKDDD